MIRCSPKSIFSWDFYLEGDGHFASLEFNWLDEQGAITADCITFDIRKHGMLSGHWTLNQTGRKVISAQKTSVFSRTFEIQNSSESVVLRAKSPFGRSFCIERSGELLAIISPDHFLTRRATIKIIAQNWDFPTVSFSFWLAVLTWRRANQNS